MELTALEPTDPRLRQVCAEVSRAELRTKAFQSQIEQMLGFVYGQNNKGASRSRRRPMTVGLSANQIGIMKQISVVDMAVGSKDFSDIHVLINPQLIWHGKALHQAREGCVNLPEVWGLVERYQRVKVKALDRSGNTLLISAKGWTAVLLQHEIDHLHGRLFIDRLPDPSKAHLVTKTTLKDYRRDTAPAWTHHADVTHLVRPLEDPV